ncbi:hypothetical protein [Burkholderia pseudomultivorans]|uniref:Uncharacterized protein n=1 Tax=Burkholderia pseudomultivorans TaxID=1207504 RepID=A0A6P2M5B7_9BURK|nr:hypothetical protein [Burkholderia pseudomultivorans]MDR8728012.1 hypothetical protein [Burkholderia pseudomultivorans]MDR8734123.1 hypothetical protein [Burkholderia pseudomultivorans]MDR8743651.1 hypothetical protein [Burkholderia pseudomultivorans]MDR8755433.1 hypothetical protein [Burkholderia pseudomultivorans]MDR8779687.1 hypothetical protein [Burkholderia pseudomultivorans]
MENESDQMMVDEALEAETIEALRRLFANDATPDRSAPDDRRESSTLIGEVTDTHHPDAMGRVRVKWSMPDSTTREHWLECMNGVKPEIGDRVLLQSPSNWPEYLIAGLLKRKGSGEPVEPVVEPAMALSLEADKCLQVSDASGCPLLQVRASPDGPVVTLLNRNVNIEVAGKLRLSAQTLELEGGRGGVDIRTEADTVVRSRYIRLN